MAKKPPNPALRAFGRHWMKPLTLVALILPFAYLAWQWTLLLTEQENAMGFEPIAWTHHYLGDTALRILLVSLAISPLRDMTGWAPIALIRRRIGLAAFFYAMLHLLAYVWLDLDWSMAALWKDVVKRIYITFGMAAIIGLIPLAITSNNAMIRMMGRKAWERLHWLVFPIAIAAVLHYLFMVKGLQSGPLIHGAILAFLLGWRLVRWTMGKLKPAAAAA